MATQFSISGHVASSSHVGATRAGHATRGGHSLLSSNALVPSLPNPEDLESNIALALNDVPCRPGETTSITLSAPLDLSKRTSIVPPTPPIKILDMMETRPLASPKPNLLALSLNKQHPVEPLLISSILSPAQDPESFPVDSHLGSVDKVVKLISSAVNPEDNMEELASDDSGSFPDLDEDMILAQSQLDAKLKALACRETEKIGSKAKKGRKT